MYLWRKNCSSQGGGKTLLPFRESLSQATHDWFLQGPGEAVLIFQGKVSLPSAGGPQLLWGSPGLCPTQGPVHHVIHRWPCLVPGVGNPSCLVWCQSLGWGAKSPCAAPRVSVPLERALASSTLVLSWPHKRSNLHQQLYHLFINCDAGSLQSDSIPLPPLSYCRKQHYYYVLIIVVVTNICIEVQIYDSAGILLLYLRFQKCNNNPE